jgi:hypothetical protein
MMVVALVGLAVMALGLAIAFTRKGDARRAQLGSRRLEVRTAVPPADAFARLVAIAGRYRVDDRDRDRGVLVLSSNPTFTTWGFLYPVFVRADGKGSLITIGIESRFVQFGPLVGVAHRNCAAEIEAALSVPAARVA